MIREAQMDPDDGCINHPRDPASNCYCCLSNMAERLHELLTMERTRNAWMENCDELRRYCGTPHAIVLPAMDALVHVNDDLYHDRPLQRSSVQALRDFLLRIEQLPKQ